MVSERLKTDIRNTYQQFLDQIGGQARRGQLDMLGWITRQLMHTAIVQPKVVIEAGTGTGKTLGYLIPALLCAREKSKQVVVATATVSLQRQLLDKDIPLLADSVDFPITAKLAKGRRRYLCPIRIEHTRFEAGQPTESLIHPLSDGQRALIEGLHSQFHSGDFDGDLDNWESTIDSELIPLVTSDHGNCRGRRCEAIEDCPFYNARDEMEEAEIIITNHDLVLSDLALGGGVVLPAPEDAIYIFDEAHQLADKAISHQTQHMQLGSTSDWLNTLAKRLKESEKAAGNDAGAIIKRLEPNINRLLAPLASLQDSVIDWLGQYIQDNTRWSTSASGLHQYRLPAGQLPQPLADLARNGLEPAKLMVAELDNLVEYFKTDAESNKGDLDSEYARAQQSFYSDAKLRIEKGLALLNAWSRSQVEGPEARWILLRGIDLRSQLEEADPELWFSPASAAEGLDTQLWKRCAGAVLCSATLAIGRRFDRCYDALGLDAETPCYIVQGAFNYPEQGQLLLPDYACDPTDTDQHDQAIIQHLETLWDRPVGALVLFSSKAQLTRVYEAITQKQATQVLSQTALSRGAILGHHRLRRDQGETSIIFGLQSYAEGIDLPGHLLEEVVITRLPFLQPDDPIQATYAEWLEQQGQRPFFAVTVPLASIRLRQAVGRLIRSEDDQGQVVILDRRIQTKGYGQTLLDDLPSFRRVGF